VVHSLVRMAPTDKERGREGRREKDTLYEKEIAAIQREMNPSILSRSILWSVSAFLSVALSKVRSHAGRPAVLFVSLSPSLLHKEDHQSTSLALRQVKGVCLSVFPLPLYTFDRGQWFSLPQSFLFLSFLPSWLSSGLHSSKALPSFLSAESLHASKAGVSGLP